MGILLSGADVIDLAVQTEVRGENFYRQAARQADQPAARDLFTFLADEEVRHKQFFSGLAPSIIATEVDPTTWAEAAEYIAATVDQAFFSKSDAPIRAVPQGASVDDMLRLAIQFEQQTLLYFHTIRDLVQPANQPLIDKVIAEERSHVRKLSAMRANLK